MPFVEKNIRSRMRTEVGLQALASCRVRRCRGEAWRDDNVHSAFRIYLFFMVDEYYAKSIQVKTIALIK